MADDILDAAQKAINDAATGAKSIPVAGNASMPSSIPTSPAPAFPVEPPPVPTIPEPTIAPPPIEHAPVPEPISPSPVTDPSLDATKQAMMNELLGSSTVAPASTTPGTTPHQPHGSIPQRNKPKTGLILAAIAALLLTVPVAVYYVSQKDSKLTEVRSKAAWDTVYQGCTVVPNSCPAGQTCHCQNGNACTYTMCEADIADQCRAQGREYCRNGYNGNAMTCCLPGYSCGTAQNPGCFQTGCTGPSCNQPDDTPTPVPTTPVCLNIKIYKGTTQVTPATLVAGDVTTLAVKGNLSPTKARFRINGGAWQETTTKNASNEFTLSYTIPAGVPDFVIEGEVFTDGAWY